MTTTTLKNNNDDDHNIDKDGYGNDDNDNSDSKNYKFIIRLNSYPCDFANLATQLPLSLRLT